MNLQDKTVLITGGAKRLGSALVEGFAEAGARVAFTYRQSEAEAEALTKKIPHTWATACDLGELSSVKKIVDEVSKKFGSIDVLITSASDFYSTPFDSITEEDWHHFIKVNLTGSFFFSWQVGLEMKKRKTGRIIHIADWAAEKPYKNYLPYTISKSGILGLTRGLALELAPDVLVNAISPGPVLPPEAATSDQKRMLAESVPLKRLGSPADVVAASLYLARQDYTTGTILPVEGGRLLL